MVLALHVSASGSGGTSLIYDDERIFLRIGVDYCFGRFVDGGVGVRPSNITNKKISPKLAVITN